MKKILCLSLAIILLFSLSISAAATSSTPSYSSTTVEYFEDGSYLESTITASNPAARSGVTATKRLTYKNSDGDIEWTADLTGTFVYDEYSCTCTSASITYSIVNTKWKIPSAVATKLGNKAFGDLTAKYYFLGVNTKTVEKSIVLTCSRFGELS